MPGPPRNCLTAVRMGLALVLIACSITTPATAGRLVFAFSELPPWKTVDNNKHFGGAYTEILRELAKRTDTELEIVQCPIKRCLKMMQDGQADVIIGIQASPEREAYIHFLRTPYRRFSSDKVFYVPKGKATTVRSYNDLKNLRIGVKNGTQYFDRFDDDTQLSKDGTVRALFKRHYFDAYHVPRDAFPLE